MRNIVFVKYNNLRRPEFQITTTIYEENGQRMVEKMPCCEAAKAHVLSMVTNCEKLRRAHAKVKAAEPLKNGDAVCYEFLSGKTLEEEFQEFLSCPDILVEKIYKSIERIYSYTPDAMTAFSVTPEFQEVFGNISLPENTPATVAANVDLVFDNIMQQNEDWILLDYEWVLDFPIPISFLKYRTAAYFYDRHYMHLGKWYTREEYLELLGIQNDLVADYDVMEKHFQEYVRGKEWKYHTLKKYEKERMPFERYMELPGELKKRDASIAYLNNLAASKDEHIAGLEQLLDKYHRNPLYKVYRIIKKTVK